MPGSIIVAFRSISKRDVFNQVLCNVIQFNCNCKSFLPLNFSPSFPPSLPRSLVFSRRTTLYWRWYSWKSWYMSDILSLSLATLVRARPRSFGPWTALTRTWNADPCGMISIPRPSQMMSCLATSILPQESGRMVRYYSVLRVDTLPCIVMFLFT